MNLVTSGAWCAVTAWATGHLVAKSMAVIMYLGLFPGMGLTKLSAHTLNGAVTNIGRTDLGGVLVLAYFLQTLHCSSTAKVSQYRVGHQHLVLRNLKRFLAWVCP